MPQLKEKDRKQLQELFQGLKEPVTLHLFTQTFECPYCEMTREVVEEVVSLSDLLSVRLLDPTKDLQDAEKFGVDKVPAVVMTTPDKYPGIRYLGIPAGYEFSAFIEDIVMISKGDSGLPASVKNKLLDLEKPVHIQVLVSPSCPYCPPVATVAHRLAMESPLVTSDTVELTEFPYLAQRYNVKGVPMTVLNETERLAGAVPEHEIINAVLRVGKGLPLENGKEGEDTDSEE